MSREKITTKHNPESWGKEIDKLEKGESFNVYARYMYPELEKKEKEFAEIVGAPDTAIHNSGMAVITTAIEAEELNPGDIILVGREVYGETKKIYDSLKKRGVKVIKINSGDMEEVEEKIKTEKPRLIILESVANDPSNPQMQVCDIKKLAELAEGANEKYKTELSPEVLLEKYLSSRKDKIEHDIMPLDFQNKVIKKIEEFKQGNNPFVFRDIVKETEELMGIPRKDAIREVSRLVKYIIRNSREKLSLIVDNTLPSPYLYNPIKEAGDSEVEMVVVESGTKHFQKGEDKITMGIAYSSNADKIKAIKDKRMTMGTYLQPTSEKEIPKDIAKTMSEIMERHAHNALKLAEFLDKLGLEVNHPNLPQHKNSELAKEIAPEGLVTLFYVKIPDSFQFLKKIYKAGCGKIGVGGSFGHKETWILNLGETVRIAAGSENDDDFQKVMNAFKEVIKEL